ncbi:MAG: hypothetical protein JWN46_2234, partial [Acidimicrobiales bacterium]|nr:hypothetical protein [Acidimicrobiales bacterium]
GAGTGVPCAKTTTAAPSTTPAGATTTTAAAATTTTAPCVPGATGTTNLANANGAVNLPNSALGSADLGGGGARAVAASRGTGPSNQDAILTILEGAVACAIGMALAGRRRGADG